MKVTDQQINYYNVKEPSDFIFIIKSLINLSVFIELIIIVFYENVSCFLSFLRKDRYYKNNNIRNWIKDYGQYYELFVLKHRARVLWLSCFDFKEKELFVNISRGCKVYWNINYSRYMTVYEPIRNVVSKGGKKSIVPKKIKSLFTAANNVDEKPQGVFFESKLFIEHKSRYVKLCFKFRRKTNKPIYSAVIFIQYLLFKFTDGAEGLDVLTMGNNDLIIAIENIHPEVINNNSATNFKKFVNDLPCLIESNIEDPSNYSEMYNDALIIAEIMNNEKLIEKVTSLYLPG